MLIDMPIGAFPMALGVIYDDPAPDLRERGASSRTRTPPPASPPTSRRWSPRARPGRSTRSRTRSEVRIALRLARELAQRHASLSRAMLQRGKHLVAADRGFATGGGLLARLFAGGFHKLLDRIDAGLAEGRIDATLPDGTLPHARRARRGAGRRSSTSRAGARWSGSPPRARSAGTRPGRRANGRAPIRCRLFDLFMRNAASARRHRPRQGAVAGWSTGSPIALRANDQRRARRNIAHHYDLGNDFYAAWLDPGMTYSSAIFAEPISPDEPLEAAQERKVRAAARPARPEARPAPARDRLRLGRPRRDRGARLRRPRHRPHPVGRAEGLCRRAASPAPGSPTGPTIAAHRLSRRRRHASTPSPASRWSRRSARNIGRPISQSIARVLKPGGKAALQLISIRERSVRALCRQCRFHPDLHLPGRPADRRGRASARSPRRPASPGATARATASIMPRR